MKTLTALAVIAAFALSGCGGSNDPVKASGCQSPVLQTDSQALFVAASWKCGSDDLYRFNTKEARDSFKKLAEGFGRVTLKSGDTWLLMKSSGFGASDQVDPANVKTWPTKWCEAQPGMSRDQMKSLMGKPTSESDQASGDPQMSWDAAEYQFNAFFDVNDKVRQLDINDSQLTAAEKAGLTCDTTRKAQ